MNKISLQKDNKYRGHKAENLRRGLCGVIAFAAVGISLMLSGCSASAEVDETDLINRPVETQAVIPTVSPSPTVSPPPQLNPIAEPTPYLDLDNMTDEEILMKYGIPPNSEALIIGYATDNSGILVIEYVVDDIKCMSMFGSRSKGDLTSLYDLPVAEHTKSVFMITDNNTLTNNILLAGNENNFDIEPFQGELITKDGGEKSVTINHAFLLSDLRKFLESKGQIVPETKYSQDIEGNDMLGNIVLYMDMLRYFLTVAPQDETKNHIEYNYDPYVATQTPKVK